MPRLFVSYARQDLEIVRSLVADLGELGHEPFFDQNLTGGQRWWDVLLDRIQTSDGFLPVLSTAYRQSEACHREAEWADRLGIPLLPIDLGQIGPELCDPHIAEANWIRYGLDDRASVMRLARALNALPTVTLPDPLPDRPPIPISYLSATEQEIQRAPALSFERQLVIISTLRDRLGTNEDTAARILLAELRRRPDVTYSNAVEIDRMLAPPPADQPRQQPQPPPAPIRSPNAGPYPPPPPSGPMRVAPPPGGRPPGPLAPQQGGAVPPPARRRRGWIIAAVAAAVLVAAGIVAVVLASGGSGHHSLAAPQHVVLAAEGTDLNVSWDTVAGASSYRVTDSQGRPRSVTVHSTTYTLHNAIYRNHRFVIVALDSGGSAGANSAASSWAAKAHGPTLSAPSGVTITSIGFDLHVSWTAVAQATGYRIADGTTQVAETGTSHVFLNGIYSDHRYVVTAIGGSSTSPPSDPATWTAKTRLSPAEQQLAYRVPDSTADPGSCEAYPAGEKDPRVVAEIQCTAASVQGQPTMTTLFAKQIRPGSLNAYEHAHYTSTFNEPNNGVCATAGSNGARTGWSFGKGNPTIGNLFCYRLNDKTNKTTVLAWTYDSDSVVLQVQAPLSTTLGEVYTWWTKAAAHLRTTS